MSHFVILLGGDLSPTPRLRDQVAGARAIAADSGIRHAEALGLDPELWTGDFDSVDEGLRGRFERIPTEIFPAEKDMTDGEIAVDAALARGATSLVLAGAFGGRRADHAFLHLAAANRLAEGGMPVVLSSGDQEGRPLLTGDAAFDFPDGTLFSILGFTPLTGLTVRGAKWPLDDAAVPFGSSLTISNEVRGALSITLGEGRALLVAHFAEPAGA